MVRVILFLFAVLFLFCAPASAQPIQITLHLSKQLPGVSLYGDLLEQKPTDSFGTIKVSVVTDGRSARVAWNGVEYHGVVITSGRGESHIVYTDEYGLDVITLYPSGICGVTAQRVSATTGKPNIVAVPCVYN